MSGPSRVTLTLANEQDRQAIYRIRHRVYAQELHQHPENNTGLLSDALDQVNAYIVAKQHATVLGFVAITPPNPQGYSLDKYDPLPGSLVGIL